MSPESSQRPADRTDERSELEARYRFTLRVISIVTVLALIVLQIGILPIVGLIFGVGVSVDPLALATMFGALLVMLGLEVPAFLSRNGGDRGG